MDLSILEVDVNSLNEKQIEVIKKHVTERLKLINELIINENFCKLENYLKFSAAGDGYGQENTYITFDCVEDIGDIINMLKEKITLRGKPRTNTSK
jgi:hypothetical protein